jgi:diguanylate cyclase (GGDEF)-like protein
MKKTTKNILFLFFGTIVLPALIGVFLSYVCTIKIQNIPLHSTLEASGGIIAIVIAVVIFLKYRNDSLLMHFNWATMGLLVMGIFDIFHAIVMPGEIFVWLHSIAVFFGGVILMSVWLPQREVTPFIYSAIPLVFAFFALTLSLLSIVFPSFIPVMLDESGSFSTTANGLNFIGGFGFFLSSIFFIKRYIQTQKREALFFAALTMLFCVAGILFMSSSIWDLQWWLWHFIRFTAYIVAFYFLYIEYQKEIAKIEQLSITDSLTKLYNHRYFMRTVALELERAKRDGKTISFAMLDVDYFKKYNDSYGHHAGDDVLIKIAEVFSKYANRAGDYAFRVGGEEFVLLLSGLNDDNLLKHLQKLLEEVESLKIMHKDSAASSYITLSIGAKNYKDSSILPFFEIYKEIDLLLYQAKAEGRNRIVIG